MKPKGGKKKVFPSLSVVIPVEPGGSAAFSLAAAARLDYPGEVEILVAEGRNPSLQRNRAVSMARGELIYFLDSDSVPDPSSARHLAQAILADPSVAAAGGPNLPPADENAVQRAASAVLGSYFGSAASKARYRAVGDKRYSGEKELILCNWMARRQTYLESGGLREDLYPNEENEFMNRLADQGWRMIYVPGAAVRRPRRDTIAAFAHQAFRYGRGRMRQMRVSLHRGDLFQLAPLVYGLLGLSAFFCPWPAQALSYWGLAYAGPAAAASLLLALEYGWLEGSLALLMYPLRHGAYGLGLAAGLLSGRPRGLSGKVRVQKMTGKKRSRRSVRKRP